MELISLEDKFHWRQHSKMKKGLAYSSLRIIQHNNYEIYGDMHVQFKKARLLTSLIQTMV